MGQYRFSETSLKNLEGVDDRLQRIAYTVIQIIDCRVLSGLRTFKEQEQLVAEGKSKILHSRHLHGMAIDVAPYPINWQDTNGFCYFAGIMKGVAHMYGIPLRWGGDWDQDGIVIRDQTFNDLVHFEIPK